MADGTQQDNEFLASARNVILLENDDNVAPNCRFHTFLNFLSFPFTVSKPHYSTARYTQCIYIHKVNMIDPLLNEDNFTPLSLYKYKSFFFLESLFPILEIKYTSCSADSIYFTGYILLW